MRSIVQKFVLFTLMLSVLTGVKSDQPVYSKAETLSPNNIFIPVTSLSDYSSENQSLNVLTPVISLSNHRSYLQVINLDYVDATITISGYAPSGIPDGGPLNDTIAGSHSNIYDSTQRFPHVSDDFRGSFVISSDKLIAALATIGNNDLTTYAAYMGQHTGSVTVSLPLLMNDVQGVTTWYGVQNAGNADASVKITYSDGGQEVHTIPHGVAKFFYQQEEGHPDNSTFAATITSDQPIVAAVIQQSDETLAAYTGIAHDMATTNPYFPMVQQNDEVDQTGLYLQNIGDQTTEVTVAYLPVPTATSGAEAQQAGATCEETINIAPGDSAIFATSVFQGDASPGESDCSEGAFRGAAHVIVNSTEQPLVGVANLFLSGEYSAAYSAINSDEATNAVLLPSIMDRNEGNSTRLTVQHVDGPTSSVACVFHENGYITDLDYYVVQELGVDELLDIDLEDKIADNYIGTGVCVAENKETKIAAVVRQSGSAGMLAYEGIRLLYDSPVFPDLPEQVATPTNLEEATEPGYRFYLPMIVR